MTFNSRVHMICLVSSILPTIPVVLALQGVIEKARTLSLLGEQNTPGNLSVESQRANLLAMLADHGEGTTILSRTLGAHPCIISVGEPFGVTEKWFAPNGKQAFVGDGGKPGSVVTFSKLQEHLDLAMIDKGQEPFNLSSDLATKHPTFLDFFKSVQAEVCAHVKLPSVCGSRCVLAHKIFPTYVSYEYSFVDDYLKSDKTLVIQVLRDEVAVVKSNTERFGGMGDEAIAGLWGWNKFLNAKQSELSSSKTWTTMNMDGPTFSSPSSFFSELEILVKKLNLPTDEQALMAIKSQVFAEFEIYAEKKQIVRNAL